jgi:hypothetical protein
MGNVKLTPKEKNDYITKNILCLVTNHRVYLDKSDNVYVHILLESLKHRGFLEELANSNNDSGRVIIKYNSKLYDFMDKGGFEQEAVLAKLEFDLKSLDFMQKKFIWKNRKLTWGLSIGAFLVSVLALIIAYLNYTK